MPGTKNFHVLILVLLLVSAGSLQAAVVKVKGSGTIGAIDTLTLTTSAPGEGAASVDTIIFGTGATAKVTRDSAVINSAGKLDSTGLGFFQFRTTNPAVISIKLNSHEIPFEPSVWTGSNGWQYTRPRDGSAAAKIPALTPLGIAALILLLAGVAVWLFRKRNLKTA